MKNVLWYLIAVMTICLVGVNLDKAVDLIPASAQEPERRSAAINRYINNNNNPKEEIEGVFVPMPVVCFPTRQAEKSLVEEGFRILATGVRPDGDAGPELYETWMNPETKNFVILRVVATQGLSCAIAAGPLLRPGGITIQELEENKPKGQPL